MIGIFIAWAMVNKCDWQLNREWVIKEQASTRPFHDRYYHRLEPRADEYE
ncbi:MAG: hypothetical protein ACTSUE_23620 [Promethearchaeota archaeon]